jgi:two-component system nitrogen regulation sensor histidine kinase NtrY
MVSPRRRRLVQLRRLRLGAPAAVLALFALIGLVYAWWNHAEEDGSLASGSFLVFVFLYLNVLLLCALGFIVGRNIVKLVFDRRRNIVGSRLRLRLVSAFVGLTLVPLVILFVTASGLLNQAMEGWFNSQVSSALDSAIQIGREHLGSLKLSLQASGRRAAHSIERRAQAFENAEELKPILEQRRKAEGLFSLQLFDAQGIQVAEASSALSTLESFRAPQPEPHAFARALDGQSSALYEEFGASRFVRAYVPCKVRGENGLLLLSSRLSAELSQSLAIVHDSYKSYEQLTLYKQPLKSWYVLTLTLVTGLILFAAIWAGFYIARNITGPIQQLAEGTRAIARGRYDFRLPAVGDDEIGVLVRSFNTMTSDLRSSRDELLRRQHVIEVILQNLAVGVLTLDTQLKVTVANHAALELFATVATSVNSGVSLNAFVGERLFAQLQPLLQQVAEAESSVGESVVGEKEVQLSRQGREHKLLCTVGRLSGPDNKVTGFLVLFDDITDLIKAQQAAAWREVARRIAHEIKNPLTPIQLSAQRLQRIVAEQLAHSEAFKALALPIAESAQTIVENVDSIKRLANEFSQFARMPTAELEQQDLNQLVAEVLGPYAERYSGITFQFIAGAATCRAMIDREQMRRVVINLIENAIDALELSQTAQAHIVLRSFVDTRRHIVGFEVQDNGPGIPAADRLRIFEPYFTTKEEGTGLGLAIVMSIISDHQGEIRVYENQPTGARFVVELPVRPRSSTQRRLSRVS